MFSTGKSKQSGLKKKLGSDIVELFIHACAQPISPCSCTSDSFYGCNSYLYYLQPADPHLPKYSHPSTLPNLVPARSLIITSHANDVAPAARNNSNRYDHERSQLEKYPGLIIHTLTTIHFRISLVSEQDAEIEMQLGTFLNCADIFIYKRAL